jgi:hypothetical protein
VDRLLQQTSTPPAASTGAELLGALQQLAPQPEAALVLRGNRSGAAAAPPPLALTVLANLTKLAQVGASWPRSLSGSRYGAESRIS